MIEVHLYVPDEVLDVARCVNRSLDYDDVGGAGAFSAEVYRNGVRHWKYSRLCTLEHAAWYALVCTVTEELFVTCAIDYNSRFPELERPSYIDCKAFCDAVECYVGQDGFLPDASPAVTEPLESLPEPAPGSTPQELAWIY